MLLVMFIFYVLLSLLLKDIFNKYKLMFLYVDKTNRNCFERKKIFLK